MSNPRTVLRLLIHGAILSVTLGAAPSLSAQSRQFEVVGPRALPDWRSHSTAVADSDGDGIAELYGLDSVGVHGQLFGGREQLLFASSAAFPRQAEVVDIGGNGGTDLLVRPALAATSGGPLLLLAGVPTPGGLMSLQEVPLPPLGQDVRSVAAGDFDGDGDLDLVIGLARLRNGAGLVYLQQGAGGFAAAALPTAALQDARLVAGDFDGDRDLDVFGVDPSGNAVWLQNTGAGVFLDSSAFVPPTGLVDRLCVGDFDGDGYDDLGLLQIGATVTVLWGRPGGLTPGLPLAIAPATGIGVGDFTGDGRDRLVLAGDAQVWLLEQAASRVLVARPAMRVESGVASLSVGDYRLDGFADVLIATDEQTMHLLAGYPGGLIADPAQSVGPQFLGAFPGLPAVGDVNGDGLLDLMAETDAGLELHLGDGLGGYTASLAAAGTGPLAAGEPANVRIVHLVDLDGDGDLDALRVVVGALEAFRNDGTGAFALAESFAFSRLAPVFELTDLDGDGAVDIVAAEGQGVAVLRLAGSVWQSQFVQFPYFITNSYLESGDFDGDGDVDVVQGFIDGFTPIVVLENDGAGNLAIATGWTLALPGPVPSVTAVDFDGDGDLDLCAPFRNGGTLLCLRNDGARTFVDVSSAVSPARVPVARALLVGDFDQDGDDDLIGVDANLSFLRNGGGTFADATSARIGDSVPLSRSARIDDYDGDDDLDVAFVDLSGEVRIGVNHLRQLWAAAPPRIGSVWAVDLFSGPSFGPPGFSLLALAAAPATTPQRFPGITGLWLLDSNQAAIVDVRAISRIGRSQAFLNLPNRQALVGGELFVQSLIASTGAQPFGFTNARRERILP